MAARRPLNSPRAGGFTFPEDPANSCALVRPLWSAAVDPCVLRARAIPCGPEAAPNLHPLALKTRAARILMGDGCEHVRLEGGGRGVRVDIVEGSVHAGPVSLQLHISDDGRLPMQLAALRDYATIDAPAMISATDARTRNRLLALWAFDLRASGLSLRTVALHVLGPGDWPGDGDHRKSRARRLIAAGEAMVRAGPAAILA
jgi:hypothetical protein